MDQNPGDAPPAATRREPQRHAMTPKEAIALERLRAAQEVIDRKRADIATAFGARIGLPPGSPVRIDLDACEWVEVVP